MSKKVWLIIGLVVLGASVVSVLLVVLFLRGSDSDEDSYIETQSDESVMEEYTDDSPVVFTNDIFDLSHVDYITPLGNLHGGYDEVNAVAGVMIDLKVPEDGSAPDPMDIYAPTDMSLESYAYYKMSEDEGEEWSLGFRVSDDVTLQLWHIDTPVQKIRDAAVSEPKQDSRTESPSRPVEFKAGEKIAETIGTSKANNWNILVYDAGHENEFANQARYEADDLGKRLITARCPFDFYSENDREKYLAAVGYNDQSGTAVGTVNNCGSVSQDVDGTLAGIWHFSENASEGIAVERDGSFVTPLAVYKTISGSITIDMIGERPQTVFGTNSSYKDPASVTSAHCYELIDVSSNQPTGYVFFELVSDTEMKAAYSSFGNCPTEFPGDDARSYYR